MKLRKSTLDDIPAIMGIIGDAQRYLALLNIDQWQNGYPNEPQIELDIANNDSYVVVDNEDNVMATTVFTTKKEPTYDIIKGEWITPTNAIYGVIHRMAVSDKYRKFGTAKFMFSECHRLLKEQNINSLRIDTHKKNMGMQNLLRKFDYKYCGLIYVADGAERLAFELTF